MEGSTCIGCGTAHYCVNTLVINTRVKGKRTTFFVIFCLTVGLTPTLYIHLSTC